MTKKQLTDLLAELIVREYVSERDHFKDHDYALACIQRHSAYRTLAGKCNIRSAELESVTCLRFAQAVSHYRPKGDPRPSGSGIPSTL